MSDYVVSPKARAAADLFDHLARKLRTGAAHPEAMKEEARLIFAALETHHDD